MRNISFMIGKICAPCLLVLAMATSCTGHFEEYNTNQHQATEEMMSYDGLKTGSFFRQMQRNVVLFKDGVNIDSDYQIAQGLSSDIYAGYIAPTITENGGSHNGTYKFIDNWIQNIFNSAYTGVMSPWKRIARISEEIGQPEMAALATIIKVEGMHRVADTYGPIPYLNVVSGNLINEYDDLESVYREFFRELDEAIETLTLFVVNNPNGKLLEDYDLIYAGDVSKWVKFANTLRLRLAVRVSNAAPELAKEQAEKAVENHIGLITAKDERASLKHSLIQYYHPLWEICYNMNSGDARMGASMDSYMNGYADPRRAAYFTTTGSGTYRGVRLGIKTSNWTSFKGANYSNVNMNQGGTEIVWITAAESHFLRAEGALRGWAMGDTAQSFYESGITVSFSENDVAGAANYYADATSKPAAYSGAGQSNPSIAAAGTVTIAWNDTDSDETKLEKIITQKWIAIYPDGPEGWAEFRRTGYPRLFPPVNNESEGTINNTLQICRLPYPRTEYDNNAEGVATGVQLLGGVDNGGVQLWWDKR